ncbi:26S proteasome non-ATPase regulatory subunit 10 [Phalaenopsis equestris]|uniref:26S proteasome non-ATPase regulatory subunit 10 n=1 Tax=Phalaenopsis equestris TaxID=78828 RepID=UPI0009E4BDCC|nr:26S proteasome non-ATPase regulatory subunit 10 [Phalaenopsis equestris]
METPPVFQEAPRCDVCNCGFTTFRRRHHCRCCGRTLCSEHSSNQMALPQFGILSNVRVCEDCFNNRSRSGENGQRSYDTVAAVVNGVSRLNVNENDGPEANSISRAVPTVLECKCGMPLCICKPPTPDPLPSQNISVSSSHSNPRPKNPSLNQRTTGSISRKPSSSSSSSSNSKSSSFLNMGQASNGNVDKPKADYDVSGEGLRDAIKNSDPAGVRKLLSEGVDANYCDKQGMTPLHLAALFNHTEIAFILMNHGASVERKNAQGETPLDCAPTMLQYKMRQKIAEAMTDTARNQSPIN